MRHADLARELDRALPRGLPPVARTLGGRRGAAALLRSILADAALVERLARGSYAHANGFTKLVLVDLGLRGKLRLHAWAEAETRPSDVHDHRWDFRSWILAGGYRFEEHTLAPGSAWHRRRYRSPGSRDAFALDRPTRCGVRLLREGVATPGTEHALRADVMHRVTPLGEATLSLFLHGPVRRSSTNVLSEHPRLAGGETRVPIERTTAARYRAELEAALRALGTSANEAA